MAPGFIVTQHEKVMRQFAQLKSWTEQSPLDARNEKVSDWSTGQQLEHLALAGVLICTRIDIALSDPAPDRDKGVKFIAHIALKTGFIPRGKAKAPEPSRPADVIQKEALVQKMADFEARLNTFEPRLQSIATWPGRSAHPILGYFTPAQWLRFLEVHQHHHFKIIREILRA